ncbi:DUF866 domain protein [Trichocladium antarcticum]|uniref:DUF866 domain protein n=1 Tax=Trichocladium antarcticum TaxID=1450529 RepID=A0AAN6ZBH9_9PEZI|nr:DUF866 domain protein [Trichocladium antarcticum]
MFALTLTAELAGVTNLRPKDDKENQFWYTFKVQCTSCREIHPNAIGVNRHRESSATIKTVPTPYQHSEPPKAQKILEFDCRGLEFIEFNPEGDWLADGLDSTTKFEGIDLTDGECFNPDADKMASSDLTAALGFLTDAGHLLATTAPETSAHLMSRRTDLMFEHELPQPDKQRQRVCSCCGHIMFLGQGSSLQVRPDRITRLSKGKEARSLRSKPRQSGPTKAITCGHCSSLTQIKLPAPVPVSRRHTKMQTAAAPSLSKTSQEAKSSASASSKKRAKSRKAGLLALLDQSNAARSSRPGLGLSLADFMERK